ncbi:hypothetical protein [Plantactinospora sp. KLBMP9567]|uniref:hypothetical protein n=1 Tax=Plantactinospora sp. KLBMP9567 TaxID=3085900 RepID=UPI0029827ABC|nr:hypothetical protein [Plantactinospora sp. KLBMP9567]MDW5323920.1 hypothetical protein [Plantactinospora sp. KLBMP9567]
MLLSTVPFTDRSPVVGVPVLVIFCALAVRLWPLIFPRPTTAAEAQAAVRTTTGRSLLAVGLPLRPPTSVPARAPGPAGVLGRHLARPVRGCRRTSRDRW